MLEQRAISVSVEARLLIPKTWRVDGHKLITPDGKDVGVIIGLEYDCEGSVTILATDKQLAQKGADVYEYGETTITELDESATT